jgi:hypothetical protein
MILNRSSISRIKRKPTSEEIVAPWKSIKMDRLKSGLIASVWLSPHPSILATPEMFVYLIISNSYIDFHFLLRHNPGSKRAVLFIRDHLPEGQKGEQAKRCKGKKNNLMDSLLASVPFGLFARFLCA